MKPVGNHKFMGIVIGTQESICRIDKNLESKQIHMNAVMDKKKQDAILSKLRFNGNENRLQLLWHLESFPTVR